MRESGEYRRNMPWSLLWDPRLARLGRVAYPYVLELGWVWPFMFSAGALLFTPFYMVANQDPLMWRSFSSSDSLMAYMAGLNHWSDFSNHHTLNLALEAGLCFALAGWFSRVQHTSIWRWGLLATYGAVLTWTVHEGVWWLTYWATWRPDFVVFSGGGELITFSLLVLTPVMGLYAPKRYLVWMAAFQFVWALSGFPITESYKGDTPLYNSIWANAWEVGSWAWAVAGFYWLERDQLLGWYVKVERVVNHVRQPYNMLP